MNNRSIFFLLFIFLFQKQLQAQKLMHSFGGTISILYGKIKTEPLPFGFPTNDGSNFTLAQTNFTYFPRYNFVENENSSVSIGIPLGIGVGIVSNTRDDDNGIAFAYDLPIVLDYNLGCKATSETDKNFGGYLGLGFGYYKVNISQSQYSDFTGSTFGPLARAGIRFGSSAESWKGHAVTVGMFFKKGMEKDKLTTIGFNVMYDL